MNELARLMGMGRGPNSLADAARSREYDSMQHQPAPLRPDQLKGRDALTDWAIGVGERGTNPLQAMANYSQEFQNMEPMDQGLSILGGGMAGTFAGVGAKTADVAKLALAEKLKQVGIPDREIHAKTGWTFGFADGKPRFEIPDNLAKYDKDALAELKANPDFNYLQDTQPMGGVLSHKKLYSAYPDTADIKTHFMPQENMGGAFGSYAGKHDRITLGDVAGDQRSPALHELQHAIQQREGFARGGSPESFVKLANADTSLMAHKQIQPEIDKLLSQYTDGRLSEGDFNILSGKLFEDAKNALNTERAQIGFSTPHEAYRRLAGETEARLTQSRMNMTGAERAASYPPSMFDVPVSEQIVRYGDGQALSVPAKTKPTGLLDEAASYQGQHKAPMKGEGSAPLNDLSQIYPDDIYSNKAAQYYGHYGDGRDADAIRLMQQAKDKPNMPVTMYRAVPYEKSATEQLSALEKQMNTYMRRGKTPDGSAGGGWIESAYAQRSALEDAAAAQVNAPKTLINNGDWVTLSRAYAKEHGESALDGKYKIISQKVPARKLFTDGNSIHEFGYDQSGKINADLLKILGGGSAAGLLGAAGYSALQDKPDQSAPDDYRTMADKAAERINQIRLKQQKN